MPTLNLMAAGDADTLQVTQCGAAIEWQFLRINAERAQKLGQFGSGIRPFAGNELQFLSAQPDIAGHGGHFFGPAVGKFAFKPNRLPATAIGSVRMTTLLLCILFVLLHSIISFVS
jgi:hypothetical protein